MSEYEAHGRPDSHLSLLLIDNFIDRAEGVRQCIWKRLQLDALLPPKTATLSEESQHFEPIPARLVAKPSVAQQLSALSSRSHPLEPNYYFLLQDKMTNQTDIQVEPPSQDPAPTQGQLPKKTPSFAPDLISHKDLDAVIAHFKATDNEPVDDTVLIGTEVRYKARLALIVRGLSPSAEFWERIDKFFHAGKLADNSLVIKPYLADDVGKLKDIQQSIQLQTTTPLLKYFRPTGNNQKWLLTGNIHIESQYPPDAFIARLQTWCTQGQHTIRKLNCQTEETSMLGFLLKSSVTLNRTDLTVAIKQHPLWKELGEFEFGLAHRDFHSAGESVPTLCVEVPRSKAVVANEFFSRLYDGENDRLPLGVKLLFLSLHNCAATEEDRKALVQAQARFLDDERTMTVSGLKPLSTVVRLSDPKSTEITIRGLIMALQDKRNQPLFHGVDRQAVTTPFFLFKYHHEVSDEVARRVLSLEDELRKLVKLEDHGKLFTDTAAGLTFGGSFRKYKDRRVMPTPTHRPSEASRRQVENIRTALGYQGQKRDFAAAAARMEGPLSPQTARKPWQPGRLRTLPVNLPMEHETSSYKTAATLTSSVTAASNNSTTDDSRYIQLDRQVSALSSKYTALEDKVMGLDGHITELASKTETYFTLLAKHLGFPIPQEDQDMPDVLQDSQKRKRDGIIEGMAPTPGQK